MAAIFWVVIPFVIVSLNFVSSSPVPGGGGFIAASAAINKPPITFDGANVGVNFGGYHASAGLGGLLGGGAAKGGLHAEAGTPYGQNAAAGLGGVAGGASTAGELYAGATSGAGQVAEAGLGGAVSGGEVGGAVYSGAESGAAVSGSVVSSGGVGGATVIAEEKIHAAPKKTYIERTVIPNYVEKTVQVPSYVEKTIRVPTVITKKVKVEAAPTIIEKTVEAPHEVVSGETVSVVEQKNTGVVHNHWVHPKPLFGGFLAGGGLYGAGGGVGASNIGGGATYSVTKGVNREFINDIFNIPIATLGAVNKFVGGLGGGASASGSFGFHKHYGY